MPLKKGELLNKMLVLATNRLKGVTPKDLDRMARYNRFFIELQILSRETLNLK